MSRPERPPRRPVEGWRSAPVGPAGHWNRRQFLAAAGAVSVTALGLGSCSDDQPDAKPSGRSSSSTAAHPLPDPRTGIVDTDVPREGQLFGWIEEVVGHGIRRPGYPADRWAERWVADRFRAIGLDDVRMEPVDALRWRPLKWRLAVTSASGRRELTCFPVPFAAAVDHIEVTLAPFDQANPGTVRGKAALVDVSLITIPADLLATAGSAPRDATGRVFDPEGTFKRAGHTVPFGSGFQAVMEPSIGAGAAAFIGTLSKYPGDSCQYFVPYDAKRRPIPGVWLSGGDGDWLRRELATGPVRVSLEVDAETTPITTYNVLGDLAGADDEVVMIGSHHDGPWASAVEDASGMSMVLGQATYWAAQPASRRPHRLRFILQGGHMSGGAGLRGYIDRHRAELKDVVVEIHLEHVALECREDERGRVIPTDRPTPRWFFTSRIPELERAVGEAITAERLWRSLICAPDAFGDQPPTDGAFYHSAGVPIVNVLAAPFYLFDRMDTLDKIDRASLVPLTRATIRLVEFTRSRSAAQLRSQVVR